MTLRLRWCGFYLRFWYYLLPLLAFSVAAYLRFFSFSGHFEVSQVDPRFYFVVLLLQTLLWAIAVDHYQLSSMEELFREYTGIRKSVSACAATDAVLLAVLFFYRQQNFSRVFFMTSAIVLLLFTICSRPILRRLLWSTGRHRPAVRVLLVGADSHARRIAPRLARIPFASFDVVAHVRLPGQEVAISDLPVYEVEHLGNGAMVPFDEVVIAVEPERLSSLSGIVSRIEVLCVPIRAILNLGDLPLIRERIFQFGDLQMLDLANTPLELFSYVLLKRVFDITFSSLMILFAGPLMLVIALAVKLTSPGPVLFRQQRVGLNGRSFSMYKFRTMRVESLGESNTTWTTQGDPRRTTIGCLLRKSSMDELPQFFNVLRGDMSVVGPRPERPHFVKKFLDEISHYDSRHRLKVGITGWAQVNGWRGDTSIRKRFEFDLYYLQNWSFWFDLRIILLTVWLGVFGKNAY